MNTKEKNTWEEVARDCSDTDVAAHAGAAIRKVVGVAICSSCRCGIHTNSTEQ